jgi:hypothetical protein
MTGTTKRNSSHLRRSGTLVLAVLAVLADVAFGPVEASAGACEKTTRTLLAEDWKGFTAHSIVQNDAKANSYDIVIARDGKEVQSATVPPRGGSVGKDAKIDNLKGYMTVSISQAGAPENQTTCYYNVKILNGFDTRWTPGTATNDSILCTDNLNISCSKDFHQAKARWDTSFVISD